MCFSPITNAVSVDIDDDITLFYLMFLLLCCCFNLTTLFLVGLDLQSG